MAVKKSLPFDYQVRRSVRAIKTRIVVTADKVEVVIPNKFSLGGAHRFVSDNQDWISKTLDKLRAKEQGRVMAPQHYQQGAMIPYLGESWSLTVVSTQLKRVKIEFKDSFKAHVPVSLATADKEYGIRLALIKWLKNSTRIQAETIVAKYQDKHQLRPKSIRIKAQKSRWGSCGINDDININWLLILAPPIILEYVVVHELCHLRQRNHSADFWALVAAHMPDYQQHRVWLRNHGSVLMKGL